MPKSCPGRSDGQRTRLAARPQVHAAVPCCPPRPNTRIRIQRHACEDRSFDDTHLRRIRRRPEGGRVLVHDAYSSIGVTLGVLAKVLPSSTLRYVGRSDSMALFVKEAPVGADRRAPGGAPVVAAQRRHQGASAAPPAPRGRRSWARLAVRPLLGPNRRRNGRFVGVGRRREQSCAARFTLLRPTDGRSFDPGECGRTQGNGHGRDRPDPDEEPED